MTEEEMREVANEVIRALRSGGLQNVELLDFTPGEPLPIMFDKEDNTFALDLMLA